MAVHVPPPVPRTDGPAPSGPALPAHAVAKATITLKVLLVLAMVRVLLDPGWANLEGKAPVARAILFPLLLLVVPAFWAFARRPADYPWGADLLVALGCSIDVLGNRLGLYDTVAWFDDAVHLVGAAIVSTVFVVLTLPDTRSFPRVAEAAIAAGLTASLAWELFEYGAFLTRSTEWTSAYSDTIGDLTLGWVGSLLAAALVVRVAGAGRRPQSRVTGPWSSGSRRRTPEAGSRERST